MTTPDTPQYNGFAERLNRTYMDPVRVLLEQAGLSSRYWHWALYYVVFIKNRLLHFALGMFPYKS